MNMRLPAYPLITIDPFCSIWSPGDELNRVDTILWNDISKKMLGYIRIDGTYRRFLGKGHVSDEYLWQTDLDVTPFFTTYTLECEQIRLKVKFWTPLFLDDFYTLSLPISFIEYEIDSIDGKEHEIEVHLRLHEEFCSEKPGAKRYESFGNYGVIYNEKQVPLGYSGDCVDADWGYYYLFGDKVITKEDSYYRLESIHQGKGTHFTGTDIFAFDDVFSIEYMGRPLKCIWTEKYKDIFEAVAFCKKNYHRLYEKALEWDSRILKDAADFGEDYQKIVTAAYRQVLSGHKLVRDTDGKMLYLSKECLSNGCINTVDITYPSVPLFLLYAPELLPSMMEAIFEFAALPVWKFSYSPHDIGTYPLADGHLYGCKLTTVSEQRNIYKMTAEDAIYKEDEQMPVENSGNMIIMTYAYYLMTGDLSYVKKHYARLKQWADYLLLKGDCKELQLCTDDFAGKFVGNINLAIKAAIAITTFGRIAELCGEDAESYYADAHTKAQHIEKEGRDGDHLAVAFETKPSWSLKYNLIWDRLFQLELFSDTIYETENALYLREEKEFGVPLNSLRRFTKSDWIMWVSALEQSGATTKRFAATMVKTLTEMKSRMPFPDFYDATDGHWLNMLCHRTVQGGVWMPVLAKRMQLL